MYAMTDRHKLNGLSYLAISDVDTKINIAKGTRTDFS